MSRINRSKRKVAKGPLFDAAELPKKDNMDSFQILMVIGFFLAALKTLIYFQKLDLALFGLFKLYCLFLGASFLIPISWYRKKLTMSFYEYIIFNVITFSPGLLAIIFIINSITTSAVYIESYKIVNMEQTEFETTYVLENNAYEDKEYLRSINDKDEVEISGNEFLSIHFADGLLGLRTVEKKELH